MDVRMEPSWHSLLSSEFKKPYFLELTDFVKNEYKTQIVYPAGKEIFAALDYCPLSELRVVIIGQDPYHGVGQANGLCFSVKSGVKPPPSLVNIFKELNTDLDVPIAKTGDLERWAKQGVLLLNATLTVRANSPGSHQNHGWEIFTDRIIELVSKNMEHVVFILWGAFAQKKAILIDSGKHFVVSSPHPSPFSAHNGFFGSKPFSKTNNYLKKVGLKEINW